MKKTGIFLMVIALVVCMQTPTFATYTDHNDMVEVSINEFNEMKSLSLMTDGQLVDKGYTSNEIENIRNYRKDYDTHIYGLQELPDEVLEANGYSDKQIEAIRKYDGSNQLAVLASASLKFTSHTVDSLIYNGNYSVGKLSYSWEWSGIPAFKLTDMVAVSWNNWAVTDNYCTVVYYNKTTGKAVDNRQATYTTDGNGLKGAAHKFSMAINDNADYAKSGAGYFKIKSDVHAKKDCYYYIAYGHKTLTANISFSVGTGGADGSITFSLNTTIEADKADHKVCS